MVPLSYELQSYAQISQSGVYASRLLQAGFNQGSTDMGSKLSRLLQSHLLQFDVTPAGGRYCSYLLPKQDGVTSNCSKWAICCNYLARILTPCPAYLCSLKYLAKNDRLI